MSSTEFKAIRKLRIKETCEETIVFSVKDSFIARNNIGRATGIVFKLPLNINVDSAVQVFEVLDKLYLIDSVTKNEDHTLYECTEIAIIEAE